MATSRTYFAYSPLIDPATFEGLPEGQVAEALDVDLEYNLPSPRWGGRIAGIIRRPGHTVYGRLYQVTEERWPAIQQAEGARNGKLVETTVQVRVKGKKAEAIAFTTNPQLSTDKGLVSQQYADALAADAESSGFPAEYVNRLKAEAAIPQKVQSFGARMGLK